MDATRLDPLTPAEIETAVAIVRRERASLPSSGHQ